MQIDLHLTSPTEHSARQARVDAVANRVRILAVAEQLFAEHGVAETCMAEIARAAGVGKGTLYRHFANKGELCLGLMDTQLRIFQDTTLHWLQEMVEAETPYLEQLKGFLDRLVYFTHRHMPLLREVQVHSVQLDQGDLVRPHFWQYMTVQGLLVAAARAGELANNIDTPFMAEALLAPMSPYIFHFQIAELDLSLARISSGMQIMVDGLSRL